MRRKGFTLIELLAIIVILAIIALIAIPVVFSIIDKVRVASYARSADNILEATRIYFKETQMDSTMSIEGDNYNKIMENISGRKPDSGEIFITESGDIALSLKYDKYCYKKLYKEMGISKYETADCSLAVDLDENEPIVLANINDITVMENSSYNIIDYFSIEQNGVASIKDVECTSSLDGVVASTNELSVGVHTITCNATKANGKSKSDNVKIIVVSEQEKVYINNLTQENSDNGNLDILGLNETTLSSVITLSTNKETSSTQGSNKVSDSFVAYEISIYNPTTSSYEFSEIEEILHDNLNITYTLNGLSIGETIASKETKTFIITYKYTDNYKGGVVDNYTSSSENILNSTLNFKFKSPSYVVNTYNTAGTYTFTAPKSGKYLFELWGAQGSLVDVSGSVGGLGGYTAGEIYLNETTQLYIYVGGHAYEKYDYTLFNNGTSDGGGWNGGGATDVRVVNGSWNNINSLRSRIMVAGGGGAGYGGARVGVGGGITGGSGGYTAGGTQTNATNNGYGNSTFGIANGGCSGGNGYYPAGGAYCQSGSGGGSSFISGHTGCVAVTSESSTNPRTGTNNQACSSGTDDNLCSVHYSNYIFENTVMIDGAGYKWTNIKGEYTGMPTHDGSSTMVGNNGVGYAKVTFIG